MLLFWNQELECDSEGRQQNNIITVAQNIRFLWLTSGQKTTTIVPSEEYCVVFHVTVSSISQ